MKPGMRPASEMGRKFNIALQQMASYAHKAIRAISNDIKLDHLAESISYLADALACGGQDLHDRLGNIEDTIALYTTTRTFGRKVEIEIGEELDECGQFPIALWVDDKERFRAFFTDKREDEERDEQEGART